MVSRFFWFIRVEHTFELKEWIHMTYPIFGKKSGGGQSISTSLQYHALGIKGYQYVHTKYTEGEHSSE